MLKKIIKKERNKKSIIIKTNNKSYKLDIFNEYGYQTIKNDVNKNRIKRKNSKIKRNNELY